MNKFIVALSLGCLAVCARAEIVDKRLKAQPGEASHHDILPWFAAETELGSPDISLKLYRVAPGINAIPKNNYTLLLGSWPHAFTLDDMHAYKGHDFYAIAEKNLGKHLRVFMRVEQVDTAQLPGYIFGPEGLASRMLPEYSVGTGFLLNDSLQPGDGLGIAIAHQPHFRSLPVGYANGENSDTAWELSYFISLVKRLKAQTSLHYPIAPGEDIKLEETIAAELRLNFTF